MLEQMKWEEVYKLWQQGSNSFPRLLTAPITVETVHVEYNRDGYIYGYDWLENEEAFARKELIAKNPVEFLCFTKPSNKGTIHTAEMLAKAQDEEERAAIWIAATAFELMERRWIEENLYYVEILYDSACSFLRQRCEIWHHAMRKLVPDIMIPNIILSSIQRDRAEVAMGLIQMNIVMLQGTHTILLYSSLDDGMSSDERKSASPIIKSESGWKY